MKGNYILKTNRTFNMRAPAIRVGGGPDILLVVQYYYYYYYYYCYCYTTTTTTTTIYTQRTD